MSLSRSSGTLPGLRASLQLDINGESTTLRRIEAKLHVPVTTKAVTVAVATARSYKAFTNVKETHAAQLALVTPMGLMVNDRYPGWPWAHRRKAHQPVCGRSTTGCRLQRCALALEAHTAHLPSHTPCAHAHCHVRLSLVHRPPTAATGRWFCLYHHRPRQSSIVLDAGGGAALAGAATGGSTMGSTPQQPLPPQASSSRSGRSRRRSSSSSRCRRRRRSRSSSRSQPAATPAAPQPASAVALAHPAAGTPLL